MDGKVDLQGPLRAVVRAPMVRMALPFILGLVIAGSCSLPLLPGLVLMGFFTLLVVLSLWSGIHRSHRWEHGLLVPGWALLFGMSWYPVRDVRQHPDHVRFHAAGKGTWAVQVEVINGARDHVIRAEASVLAILEGAAATPRKGRVMVTLLRKEGDPMLRPGDRLLLDAELEPIDRIPDPGGFDRRAWAASRLIHHEIFVPSGQWQWVGHQRRWTDVFMEARASLDTWLRGSSLGERDRALAKALLLGQRDELDGDQRTSFVRSGTIHVLAVSGMHVGLIYAVLGVLLGWLGETERARWARGIVILLSLWAYAGLTGGSPSVLRASLMFSLFTLANMASQRTDHLNSLFAAALILLLVDPTMLWSISFQLSFLAVLGIILFYRPLKVLWLPRQKLLRGMWSLAVVSLSAQLLTTPVSLLLFKAFPVWFLPANIVVVTLVGVAVNGSLLVMLLYKVPLLGDLITWSVGKLLWSIGWFTEMVAVWPMAYPAIRIGGWDVVWLYVGILAAAAWWQWGWKSMRWPVGAASVLLVIGWILRAEARDEGDMFVVYDDHKALQAALVTGRDWLVLVNDTSQEGRDRSTRRISSHERATGLRKPKVLSAAMLWEPAVERHHRFIWGGGAWRSARLAIAFHRQDDHWPAAQEGVLWDALVFHDVRFIEPVQLDQMAASSGRWVLANGIGRRARERILAMAAERGIPVHDLREQGAFILEHSRSAKY